MKGRYSAPLRFTLDGFHNRPASGWRSATASIQTNARRHARENGAAGIWRADGSLVLYFREGARVRQHTFRFAAPEGGAS